MYNVATEETYQDGQVIFSEGSRGDWLYVILSGTVEISRTVQGKKHVVEILKAGEIFGELGFIGGIHRTATASARGETTLGLLDREMLEKEFNQLSGQFRSILETIIRRFAKMLDKTCSMDQRTEPRVQKVLSVVFKDPKAFATVYTYNVSPGGLFLKTATPLAKGTQFLLKLQLPGVTKPLQIQSEVVWSRDRNQAEAGHPPGMGVKFLTLSDADEAVLRDFLVIPSEYD